MDIRSGINNVIYPTAGDAVRDQIGSIDNFINSFLVEYIEYINSWSQGTINGTTGENAVASTRCRSSAYIQFKTARDFVIITVPNGFKMSVRVYSDNSGTYIDGGSFKENILTITNVNPDYYYRFVIAYTDDSKITPSNISNDTVSYMLYRATDKSLSLDGKIADAKETGDYIRAVDNAKNLINNTLFPVDNPTESRPKIGENGYFYNSAATNCETTKHGIKIIANQNHEFAGGFVSNNISLDNAGLETGKDYVLSFDIEYKLFNPNVAKTRYISVYLVEADAESSLPTLLQTSSSNASLFTSIDTVTQDKKDVTQNISGKFIFSLQPTTKKFQIVFRGSATGNNEYVLGNYIAIKNIMLQEGTYPTAWIPSITDIINNDVDAAPLIVKRNNPDEMLDKL